MGADFKEKSKDSFKKSWDRAAVAAQSPDLFSRPLSGNAVCVEGDLTPGATLKADEAVVLRRRGESIAAFRGITEVAVFANPPSDLLNAMGTSCEIAEARVRMVDPASGVGEFEIVK